jgi:hypothetical protein
MKEITKDNLLEEMWGLVCNVSGGDWRLQTKEWQDAADRIRSIYFNLKSTNMSLHQNQELQEQQFEARQEWLAQNLSKEEDVKSDTNGEFIVWTENDGATEKIYLPVELTLTVINNLSYALQN